MQLLQCAVDTRTPNLKTTTKRRITIRCTRSRGPRGFFCLQVDRRGPVIVAVITLKELLIARLIRQSLPERCHRHSPYLASWLAPKCISLLYRSSRCRNDDYGNDGGNLFRDLRAVNDAIRRSECNIAKQSLSHNDRLRSAYVRHRNSLSNVEASPETELMAARIDLIHSSC